MFSSLLAVRLEMWIVWAALALAALIYLAVVQLTKRFGKGGAVEESAELFKDTEVALDEDDGEIAAAIAAVMLLLEAEKAERGSQGARFIVRKVRKL
ncbi:MAG: hypothetical protein ACOYIN_02755 [Christensenellales bacterium]|jgi:hypothetical protein|nr:hypothetical protein [Eubacteriales bacterium]